MWFPAPKVGIIPPETLLTLVGNATAGFPTPLSHTRATNKSEELVKDRRKIRFQLERDEHGYAPTNFEGLRGAMRADGNFMIDNIPFFVRGLSDGDVVSVRREAGELIFAELVEPSTSSTFRVIPTDLAKSAEIRADLKEPGCGTEYGQVVGLISVDVPGSTPIESLGYILEKKRDGAVDFEEGVLRHEL